MLTYLEIAMSLLPILGLAVGLGVGQPVAKPARTAYPWADNRAHHDKPGE